MAPANSKRIFTSVRPARVACLIYQDDDDWQESCLRIIEFFSSVWGGAYDIIVPTDGKDLIKSDSISRKPEFELDIAAIVDGAIVLGEAKKNGRLDIKEIKKYLYIAKKIGAQKLVFATFAPSWSAETQGNIDTIITPAEIEPIILTHTNLVSGR
jgi:hypothetical protein